MPSIKELPEEAQPRRRLRDVGPKGLSDAELLALLLRSGTRGISVLELAQRLLTKHGGWTGLLRADYTDLAGEHALGEAKACVVLAALEVSRRMPVAGYGARTPVRSAADLARLFMLEMGALPQEELRVVCLDTRGRIEASSTLYTGTLVSIPIRPAEIFREPIRRNSAAIVLLHNHPSGLAEPSPEDRAFTETIACAGEMLDIPLHDHIIIGHGTYFSFRENGWSPVAARVIGEAL